MREMKAVLPEMKAREREDLLKKLWRMAKVKRFLDGHLEQEYSIQKAKVEAVRFRKYRVWLGELDQQLQKARRELVAAAEKANQYPRWSPKDDDPKMDYWKKLHKVTVSDVLHAIGNAGGQLDRAIYFVGRREYALAAMVHRPLRTRAEKKLVPKEPRELENRFFLNEKDKIIDLTFEAKVDSVLKQYRTKAGQPIPRHDQIIAAVFRNGFGQTIAEDSIRRYLSRTNPKR